MSCLEKGYIIRYGLGEDISNSENKIIFRKLSDGSKKIFDSSNGMVLGTDDYYEEGELIYSGNTYVTLDTAEVGCFENGYWLVKLISVYVTITKESKEVLMEIYN